MTARKLSYFLFIGCAAALLGSCGGGGGASPPPPPGTLLLSTTRISFKAAGPFAGPPPSQAITGTVTGMTTSGTLYIKVVADNPNKFFTVSGVSISGDSGQVQVIPAAATGLKVGDDLQGSVTVTACLNDPSCQTGQLAGSPQTIPVDYEVASGVDGDTVTPRVVAANTLGTVILRGGGFTGATSVRFGSVAAASITVVNDTEIDASYPALPAGTYPVSINSGNIAYTASLIAVSPPAFTQTLISYPSRVEGQNPAELEYDPQRTALFVVLPGTTYSNNMLNFTLLRYAFDGNAWGSPAQATISGLQEIHLSPDGSYLLALISPSDIAESMADLDPVTLSQTSIINLYQVDLSADFAVANDGNAIVVLTSGSGFFQSYAFGTFSHVFTPLSEDGLTGRNSGYPIASGNGSIVLMGGAEFLASSEMLANSTVQLSRGSTADLAGDKFISGNTVQDQNGQILGSLSTSFNVINAAGTRAYGYTADPTTCAPTLSTFDLTATPSGGPNPQFPLLAGTTPVALPGSCLSSNAKYLLAISPDGATVFIARPDGLVVQPL